jgi:hypothetical protein
MIPQTPWTLVSFNEGAMNGLKAHGTATFLLNGKKYNQCSIGFHHSNSPAQIVRSITLLNEGHGIWTEYFERRETLVLLWVRPSHALHSQWEADLSEEMNLPVLLEGKNPGFKMSEISGVLRWFHPGKRPARVLLRRDKQINFVTAEDTINAANGIWEWTLLPDGRKILTTWFQSSAKKDEAGNPTANPTIFENIGAWQSGQHIQKAVPIASGIKHFWF